MGKVFALAAGLIALAWGAQADAASPYAGVWQGTLGGKPIRVCFNAREFGTFGQYYYQAHLQTIPLNQPDDESGGFAEGGGEDGAKPRWSFRTLGGNTLEGRWTQGDKSLPIKLTRVPGLKLTEDETPCGSMLFQRPRLQGVHTVSKPAVKDGLHYTRLILDHGGHFGENVSLETFALDGAGAAIGRINAKLREPLSKTPPDWLDCIIMGANSGPYGADLSETYEPRMATRRWLVVMHHWDGFCGGAHPDSSNEAMLFDLQTGAMVDPFTWLGATAVKRENVDGTFLNSLQPAFRDVVLSGWKPDDPECAAAVREQDYWDVELTRTGFTFTPELPHVIQACGEDFKLPFAKLQPWLNDEGKKEVAALQAEVGASR